VVVVKEVKVLKVLKDRLEVEEDKVLKEHKGVKDFKGLTVQQVLRDPLAQQVQEVRRVHKVLQELRVQQDRLVLLVVSSVTIRARQLVSMHVISL
jgi:hypothetical protein